MMTFRPDGQASTRYSDRLCSNALPQRVLRHLGRSRLSLWVQEETCPGRNSRIGVRRVHLSVGNSNESDAWRQAGKPSKTIAVPWTTDIGSKPVRAQAGA
jgi:hypothetical protein